MHTILLIDDDNRLASLLEAYFARYDLKLLSEVDPLDGLKKLQENSAIELVVLDIMLPGMDGFEVCRRIRKTSDTPVLMLSARGDVMDRIIGFEIGADDYLPKPFEPRELVARIHSILKRVQVDEHINEHSNYLQWEHLLIDSCSRTAFVDQRDLNLTEKEFSLLLLVAENVDKTFSRDEIIHRLNGVDAELFSRAVDILVSRVRQKLEPIKCIQTVRGVGYRFVPPKKTKV